MGLFGNYYVRPTATAIARAWSLCRQRVKDVQTIRRHALKLAFWPDDADLDWDWIRGLHDKGIGELRIDEVIAGCDNLRIVFFKANAMIPEDSLLRIWVLTVFQKKRNDFSKHELSSFLAMRNVVVERNYRGIQGV